MLKKLHVLFFQAFKVTLAFVTAQLLFLQPIQANERGKIIFVGDSRTVQMRNYLMTADTYICKGSMGYEWFMSTALPEINIIKEPEDIIVFNFGVNDMYRVNDYVSTLNSLVDNEWADCTVYYMSVNPVNDRKTTTYGGVTNAEILKFNQTMLANKSEKIQWIDTYTTSLGLINTNPNKSDEMGVHYSCDVYQMYYDTIMQQIANDQRAAIEKQQQEKEESIVKYVV